MESEEKLCVKVLRTLQQMLLKKTKYGDRVSARGAGRQADAACVLVGSMNGQGGSLAATCVHSAVALVCFCFFHRVW